VNILESPVVAQAPKHIRAILAATGETLALLFDIEPTFADPHVSPAHRPRENEVNVIVGFTGAVQGQILLGMTRQAACAMASVLLMEELTEWGEMATSGMAEIANIVAGGCATSLHQKGWPSNITVPSVIAGEKVQISWPNLFVLETTLNLPMGAISMAVGLKVANAENA
jgi:CheY-specific phosphatase CheX